MLQQNKTFSAEENDIIIRLSDNDVVIDQMLFGKGRKFSIVHQGLPRHEIHKNGKQLIHSFSLSPYVKFPGSFFLFPLYKGLVSQNDNPRMQILMIG